jgi:anti-sigma factor RsiW
LTHPDELLSAYLDGQTPTSEVDRVERHLDQCLRCRRTLRELGSARSAVRSLPLLPMPAGLVGAEDTLDQSPRRRPAMWAGAAAAAVAAIIAVATIVTSPPEPLDIGHVSLQFDARSSFDAGIAPLKVVLPGGDLE